jgi:hypothetical protein
LTSIYVAISLWNTRKFNFLSQTNGEIYRQLKLSNDFLAYQFSNVTFVIEISNKNIEFHLTAILSPSMLECSVKLSPSNRFTAVVNQFCPLDNKTFKSIAEQPPSPFVSQAILSDPSSLGDPDFKEFDVNKSILAAASSSLAQIFKKYN